MNNSDNEFKKFVKAVFIVAGVFFVGVCTVYAVLGYTIAHFVKKLW